MSATLSLSLHCDAPIALAAEFDCASGELVALVGPSGSGKTTLLRAIAGLHRPARMQGFIRVGNAVWFDSELHINLSPQERCAGLVFQNYALFPHLSAIENIAVCAYSTWSKSEKQAKSRALLARLGLHGLEQRLPHQLSGGQQQRLALARALMRVMPPGDLARPTDSTTTARPALLLLDEPFSAVDAPLRQMLYHELAQLHASLALPILLVTHDLAEARRLADRVVILDAGRSLQSGPPERVIRSPRNARVAQLVGIHNHFAGQFFTAENNAADPGVRQPTASPPSATPPLGSLRWGSLRLRVLDKGKIANDTAVTWVLAGDLLEVRATSQVEAQEFNQVECRLSEMLPLGEICVCKLVALRSGCQLGSVGAHSDEAGGWAPDDTLTLNVSTALLRQLQIVQGGTLCLCIPSAAVHIMPLR